MNFISFYDFPYIYIYMGIRIPTDCHIFQMGLKPPTRKCVKHGLSEQP